MIASEGNALVRVNSCYSIAIRGNKQWLNNLKTEKSKKLLSSN
jgi:hypothetical protein